MTVWLTPDTVDTSSWWWVEIPPETSRAVYVITPWCRVLLEKLTGLQLVKKFPAFHGTLKVHYRTHKRPPPVSILGQPNPVHIPTSHLLQIHPNIIHPSTPRSPHWSPSLRFPHQDPIHPLSSPICASCPAHLNLLDFVEQFTDINILYIAASCWIIIATWYTMYEPLNIKFSEIFHFPSSRQLRPVYKVEANLHVFHSSGQKAKCAKNRTGLQRTPP